MNGPPPDQAHRERVATELDTTLFVEAGAGSGKTTALVGRVVALVTSGTAELREIAAITFTEKAAAELRDRVRQGLEEEAEKARGAGDPVTAERCDLAIDQLDSAAIGTLHAFAQRVLAENPIEAGLPPRVEILDEVSSEVAFEQRWRTFRDDLLADPSMQRTLLLLFAAGIRPEALRTLAVEFDRNWDLVAERVPADQPDPPPLLARLAAALDVVDAACRHAGSCRADGDKLLTRIAEIQAWSQAMRGLDDELDVLDELVGAGALTKPKFGGRLGVKGNWSCDVEAVRADVKAAGDALDLITVEVATACTERVAAELRRFTLDAAQSRQTRGELAFHDLLVLSRSLVRDEIHGPAVRERLHGRYRRLLLDEFQDTDPIQIELAVRIAAARPLEQDAGRLPWDQVDVTPGQLFVVGDPKQSIYRFRRADVSVFMAAQAHFGAGGKLVELSANFRTVAPIIEWVNQVFDKLMSEGPAVDLPVRSQPSYVALAPTRAAPPVGPAVSVLARTPVPKATASELRAAEASEVALAIAQAVGQRWSVRDGDGWRDARLGDITVLVPARTSLPFLEDALDAANIAYRAESSSLVYASRAVRDLLLTMRAVDDPTDHLAIVSALRTPLFACGDDDLVRFKVEHGGHWNYLAPAPDGAADHPVTAGLGYLRTLHHQRQWITPAELLDRLARDRRVFELGFAEGRTRDVWRRLRFVIDQAREWSEATNGGLRAYLDWVRRQTSEGSRVAEAVLPETDDDAVRIMTIHAAKGLEFPITIVSGMSTAPQSRTSPAQVVFPPTGGVGYRFGRHVTTEEFALFAPIDEQMGFDERVRLLYVACTRAKDHLVVSLQRKERGSASETAKSASRTSAELLVEGAGDRLAELPPAVDQLVASPALAPPPAPAAPAPFADWEAELAEALRRGSRPTTVAATALTDEGGPDPEAEPAAGLQKRPRDQDLAPWLKGRYGTAVGRAVHGTLQTVDLATGKGLVDAVAAQCQAEAIPDRAAEVEALVRTALASDVVREASAGPYRREVYACIPTTGGRLLEGYIDLLYRTPSGMVVADYKTSASSDPAELARRVDGYRLQGASYALTVAQTTGETVERVVFVFLTPSGAVTLDLPDVDAAIAEVEALIAAGAERVVP